MANGLLNAIWLPAFVVVAISAWAQPQPPPNPAAQSASVTSSTPAANSRGDYKVGPGDVLEFKFFYNPELSESMQVRPDGKVSFGLIGEVSVEGRTVPDIQTDLEKRYASILSRPAVNVIVRTFASQKVYVGGEVNRPSAIPLVGGLTAGAAILEAGGPTRTGAVSRAILIRLGENGMPVSQTLNLDANNSAGAPVKLLPFDVVLIPATRIAKVDRWVDQYLRQVIPVGLAGGFSYLFNPVQVVPSR